MYVSNAASNKGLSCAPRFPANETVALIGAKEHYELYSFKPIHDEAGELCAKSTAEAYGYRGRIGKISNQGKLKYTGKFRSWLGSLQDYCCGYCGEKTDSGHIDHIVPRSKGGSHLPPNLMYACPSCNTAKCNHDLAWMLAVIQLRGSRVHGIVSPTQARKLMDIGIDIGLPDISGLFFESKSWPHIEGAEQ